jgi:hypothetical protein
MVGSKALIELIFLVYWRTRRSLRLPNSRVRKFWIMLNELARASLSACPHGLRKTGDFRTFDVSTGYPETLGHSRLLQQATYLLALLGDLRPKT